jgi:putative DNA primase/helicase
MGMPSPQTFARALGGKVVKANEVRAPGPGHSAQDDSLVVTINGDDFTVYSHADDDWKECRDYVSDKVGLPLWKPNGGNGVSHRASDGAVERALMAAVAKQSREKPKGRIVASYDYTDKDGTLLYQVVRLEPKRFWQRRPDGKGGWIGNLDGVRRVLYRWPELLKFPDATVFITEGEKDADRVASLGHCATTVAYGKWTDDCAKALVGRDCIILEDNDKKGRARAREAATVLRGIARTIRIVALPDLPEKGDVSDWLDADPRRAEKLIEVCFDVREWELDEEPNGLAAPDSEARPPAFSDEALALRFAELHAADLRYVAGWGRWLSYDETCWHFDDTLLSFDRARKICRDAAAQCNKPKTATALASAKTVAAISTLAKADRRLAATIDQWDADPWLLNTPSGVIDLHNGTSRLHRSDDYLTKLTGVAPDAGCSISKWLSFLDRVTGGNPDLIAFIQRMAGYALTGSTLEHAMFFLYGTGANGKSTLVNALTSCAGDYHRTSPIETFTDSVNERHPTDLAGLRGARLVTAVETEEGRRWAESKIKTLTGGDTVSARFMRQDFFEYVPQFKLVIAGNHKPGLRSVDEAIRRRLHLVPFTVTIPPKERDAELPDKLKTEWPGILAWMIRGCLDWQKVGLAPPAAVTAATAAYLDAEDALAAWIDDCCEPDPQYWERSSDLFASWSAWATRAGEHVGAQKRFAERLEARGVMPVRRMDGRGFVGLYLKTQQNRAL